MKKNTVRRIFALFLCLVLMVSLSACKEESPGKANSASDTAQGSDDSISSGQNPSSMSSNDPTSSGQNSSSMSSSGGTQSGSGNDTTPKSDSPTVTLATQVAPNICIVGGSCAKGTEYVTVSGSGVTTTKIVPFAGRYSDYFLGQVPFTKSTQISVTAKQNGRAESDGTSQHVSYQTMSENYMEKHEYRPVIGTNSRAHFYSALLSYSLSTGKLTSHMRSQAQMNISSLVNQASSAGAQTIFLIIPSSAQIYPETVPSKYAKTNGETLYQAFEKIATAAGAKVFYPLETMKNHKNDGEGYQIYQHTDSHWSPYGAYWGTYDMLNYISQTFPSAAPRTVKQMGFYTAELCGGDALFNFPAGIGFESDPQFGRTSKTGIKELTNLYTLNVKTLNSIYNNNTGLYLTNGNAAANIEYNQNPQGLPNAVIMRDSFGKVAYDMLSDRFATTCWGEFDNYNLPYGWESTNPDYVIHLYSERNLLKIMLGNSAASIVNLK